MLIINADDWGFNKLATDRCLSCYNNDRLTSATAMMFMEDSERSAELALDNNLGTGLHLNFTEKFSGRVYSSRLGEYHRDITAFFSRGRFRFLLFNPLLRKQIEYVYKAQYEEYTRLYNKVPTHIDGHHHMHLCTNMIIGRIIPKGTRVRLSLYHEPSQISLRNILYRQTVNAWLKRYYNCTDFLFDIKPIPSQKRLKKIINLAEALNIELMVHPEVKEEYDYLMGEEFQDMISCVEKGSYSNL